MSSQLLGQTVETVPTRQVLPISPGRAGYTRSAPRRLRAALHPLPKGVENEGITHPGSLPRAVRQSRSTRLSVEEGEEDQEERKESCPGQSA